MSKIKTLVILAVTLALGACAASYNGGYPASWILDKPADGKAAPAK
jgi:hypothetical protein